MVHFKPATDKNRRFRCLLYETAAVSGWTAASAIKADTAALDSIMLFFARKLMRDRALREISQLDGPPCVFGELQTSHSGAAYVVSPCPSSCLSVVLIGGKLLRQI